MCHANKYFMLIVLIATTACGGQSGTPTNTPIAPAFAGMMTTLPFVSVSQGSVLGDSPEQPYYTVISRVEQWDQVRAHLPQQVVDEGRTAMQKESGDWVIVAYGGVKATSSYSITIQRVERYGENKIAVTIAQSEPGERSAGSPANTLPYHIIGLRQMDVSGFGQQTLVAFRDVNGVELTRLTIAP
jgi:hypothetical protein